MKKEEFEKIASTPITMECFEMDDFENVGFGDYKEYEQTLNFWIHLIDGLELLRQKYNETKDKRYLKELIRLLPNSYKVVKL